MRISDWSSDVCSSDLLSRQTRAAGRRCLLSCSVISSQCVVEIIDRPYMVARPVAWNGGKSCVNPATQRLVEIGLPGNAFPLPDCELRENGIFDAVEPLHAQNARIQQLLA